MAKKILPTLMPQNAAVADAKTLGELIKATRTAMNMKLVDCASLCGVGVNTLSRLENGNPNCTLAAAFSVLQGLGIKLNHQSQNNTINNDEGWV